MRARRQNDPVPIRITDPADPRLAAFRDLKDSALDRHGCFIVEGAIALERLIRASRFPVQSLLIAEARQGPLAPLLEYLSPKVPVYVASQPVMDAIAGFHIHRGVLALARRTPGQTPQELVASLPSGPVTLCVLVGLSNHDNVGACFRNAAALGADAVLLDETSCDPLYRKSIRVSSGAALTLPFARGGSGQSLLATLVEAAIAPWALSPTNGAPLHTLTPPGRLALILGAEGPGLPADLMGQARRVSIPMSAGMDSLNVAAAGAIALAHVFSRRTS